MPRGISSVEILLLSALFVFAFLSRLVPLLPFGRVGFDPLFHYEFSVALLTGQTSIAIVTQLGEHVTLYYPPLFHLLSLILFLVFPAADPYLIMKIIVTALGSLQVLPIYFIVKGVSKSVTGGMLAAFLVATTPSEFHMLSWGGYANIAAFLLLTTLAYVVISGKPVATLVVSTLLFLTHHLSMLFAIGLFVPYLVLAWWETGKLPKCLVSLFASMAVAFGIFYWYALVPLFETYTQYAPRYAEFTLRSSWPELFGLPLLVLAVSGVVLWLYKSKIGFGQSEQLLLMWLLWPLLFS